MHAILKHFLITQIHALMNNVVGAPIGIRKEGLTVFKKYENIHFHVVPLKKLKTLSTLPVVPRADSIVSRNAQICCRNRNIIISNNMSMAGSVLSFLESFASSPFMVPQMTTLIAERMLIKF